MSKIKLLLTAAFVVASFAGPALADPDVPASPSSPYYPFASWESTGAPFEKCWWEEGPSRPYRLCVPTPPPHAWRY
ncbi:MAG: hypothetical protein AB7F41_14140 [Methylocystis sp.]|uniref:hypothetical protein n=1 Tax=Methylocystis sp. TaxID=1911079 RepID=UPI003D0E995A